ncbi:MAG: 3-methyl-2-oxobutanoate dehydrogenase subunit beta, partial [Candidatus Bathyarchaeota archaeon]
ILGDGYMGQMMEPVSFPKLTPQNSSKEWALTGAKDRPANLIKSLYLDPSALEKHNLVINETIQKIKRDEVQVETAQTDDAEIIIAAYGTIARIAKTAIEVLRGKGLKVGLVRPITVFPFPSKTFEEFADRRFLVVEMNFGQMLEDVKLSLGGRTSVHFYGRTGVVPNYDEIIIEVEKLASRK